MTPSPQAGPSAQLEISKVDMFSDLQLLASQIDSANRAQQLVEMAQGFNAGDTQLLVDVLSMVLSKSSTISQRQAHIWASLIKIASSTRIIARNRMMIPEDISTSKEPARVKVLRRSEGGAPGIFNEKLVAWIHLSHPSILGLYAVFDNNDLCLASPNFESTIPICPHATRLPQDKQISLLLDVADGLSHMHQLNIVHGRIQPDVVLVSPNGRALITDLDASLDEDGSLPVRYSAPELLKDGDGYQPTTAVDVWAYACLCCKVLSGKPPFSHIPNDVKAGVAIAGGGKPTRPDQLNEAIWTILMTCWEQNSDRRPRMADVRKKFADIAPKGSHSGSTASVEPSSMDLSIDLERAKAILTMALTSPQSSSPKVPDHLRTILDRLVQDRKKLPKAVTAAKRLSPGDIQVLVDLIAILVSDYPCLPTTDPRGRLLHEVVAATHIYPQSCRINGVQYDSTAPLAQNPWASIYKGRGLNVRVAVMTDRDWAQGITRLLGYWTKSSHPNVSPFYGVFQEDASDSAKICVVMPLLENGNLHQYSPTLPQKARMLLILDVARGLDYLHNVIHIESDGITGRTIVISNERRALIPAYGAGSVFCEGTKDALDRYNTRFGPPGTRSGKRQDIWSFGCVSYEVLSRRRPFYHCTDDEVEDKITNGELLKRPDSSDDDMDEINNHAWELINQCCSIDPKHQPSISQILELIARMDLEPDRRPVAIPLPGPELLALRSRPEVDFSRSETVLHRIQIDTLRTPLAALLQSSIKAVSAKVVGRDHEDIRAIVDYLDRAVSESFPRAKERNRVLALLSRITSSTLIFPQRYGLEGVGRGSRKFIDEGGYGTVYQDADPSICIKKMKRLPDGALTPWIKEVILWAHSSHPNVLPFLGIFLEGSDDNPQTCLVSPFMKNGNLKNYAARLPQKSRLPLISDVVSGLRYLHDLGIVHGDLKGENILISDEGRGLITDFGASHVTTATATTTTLSTTTLRFSAPEAVIGDKRPTKQYDIWSLGCLFYVILSRKVPYYQYPMEIQIIAALSRKEPPKRPGPITTTNNSEDDEDDFDFGDDIKQDWDDIDDQEWDLIAACCTSEPANRPDIATVQELVVDLKVWDDRPTPKGTLGEQILKRRIEPQIDLNRVEDLLFGEIQSALSLNPSVPQEAAQDSGESSEDGLEFNYDQYDTDSD